MKRLDGKAALITGAARGIGRAFAEAYLREGARVAIADIDIARARETADELGERAIAVEMDVTKQASIDAAVAETVDAFGRIDILINNAALFTAAPIVEIAREDYQRVFDINVGGTLFTLQAVARHMIERGGGGKIINNGSMLSIFGAPWSPVYGASKGGVVQLTRGLATAWAADNIQVNCILPGWIDTDLTQRARREVAELHENVLKRTPAGRWGKPDDFAGVAVFFASAASDFLTGTALPVDGGYSIAI